MIRLRWVGAALLAQSFVACGGGTGQSPADGGGGHGGGGGTSGVTPLLVTITLHLENADTSTGTYFPALNAFAASFEAHGGKLTLEPRHTIAMESAGVFDWRAMEARGHAVGLHAAIGGTEPTTLIEFNRVGQMRKGALAPLVDHLTHISGNCGDVDWVRGVTELGFTATTGSTVLCLYSVPAANRPSEYQSLSCSTAADRVCHHSFPSELSQRIHPWRAGSSEAWFTDDPTGALVIFPGSGTLPCLEEEATTTGPLPSMCKLTAEDVTRALADLDAAIAIVDSNKVNTYYWVWGSWAFDSTQQAALDAFLAAMDQRAARGQIRWANVTEMEAAYLSWEAAHR
jgi:hypothetical protein